MWIKKDRNVDDKQKLMLLIFPAPTPDHHKAVFTHYIEMQ